MTEDIPFDRSLDLPPGRIEQVMPGLLRYFIKHRE
jgi:hypothetical protein